MIHNKQGWGLNEMLFLSAILLFFVLLVAVMINNLYKGLEKKQNDVPPTTKETSYSYKEIEKNLKNAAKKYCKVEECEQDMIDSDTLIEKGYITVKKMTSKNDICEGHIVIKEEYEPYIMCSNYQTEGYFYE